MALVLDIETVGAPVEEIPARALDYLYRGLERDHPDPDELERRRRELLERFGLDPTTGRVVCVGALDTETKEETAFHRGREPEILRRFWDFLAEKAPERIVTFNGKRFDFPYLNVRSAILSIAPRRRLDNEPFRTRPHFDVQEVLA